LQFEANRGRQPARVKFLSRGEDSTVFPTPDGATLSLRKLKTRLRLDKPGPLVTDRSLEAAADLRLTLDGANPDVKLTGADPLPGAVNYSIGKDPANWHTNVASSSRIVQMADRTSSHHGIVIVIRRRTLRDRRPRPLPADR
jgi:hypothetical protein